MKLPRVVASSAFAHLLGLSAVSAVASVKAADEELDDNEKEGARRAEGDDEKKGDDDAGADDGEDGDDKEKKSKKAKSKAKSKAEDDGADDDDESAEDDDEKEKAARKAERARCKAIFASAAAGVRPDMAAHLAFNTGMSATSAVAMLEAISAGSAPASGLSQRMAAVTLPNPGASTQAQPAQSQATATAQAIIAAGKLRRGEA